MPIGVVALSLVVGGIVIMNIMLMVVSERTREIGLRKALGAKRRDIIWQFLTESVTLSTMGGVVGTGLGFGAAWLVTKFTRCRRPHIYSVVMGIGMTAIVGLFFGLYPAIRAARLDPIEALQAGIEPWIHAWYACTVRRDAWDGAGTLRANKLRSVLTVLGVVIGITSIVA